MNKQEWINKAYDRLIERGVADDEKTWDWAGLIYQGAYDDYNRYPDLPMMDPEEAVDEELSCV